MEVWIVNFVVAHEFCEVYGVFSAEDKAKAYILNSELCKKGKEYGHFNIQQMTLDAMDPDLSNSYQFSVSNKE